MTVPMLLDNMPAGVSRVDKHLSEWTTEDFSSFLGCWVIANVGRHSKDVVNGGPEYHDMVGRFLGMGSETLRGDAKPTRYIYFEGGMERRVYVNLRLCMQLLNDEERF